MNTMIAKSVTLSLIAAGLVAGSSLRAAVDSAVVIGQDYTNASAPSENVDFPYEYETVGVHNGANLRLQSEYSIIFHTGPSLLQNAVLDQYGNFRLGTLNSPNTDSPNYGSKLYFSGGPRFGANDGDNTDSLWISRYNAAADVSELRVNIGDNWSGTTGIDKFVVGASDASSGAWYPQMTVQSDGNVGIGTTSPMATLHVALGSLMPAANSPQVKEVIFSAQRGGGNDPAWMNDTGAGIRLSLLHDLTGKWGACIQSVSEGSYSNTVGLGLGTSLNYSEPQIKLYVAGNGNVGIGTGTAVPANKLEVNGTIRAKEVIVEANNWPDYVFAKGAPKPSLAAWQHSIDTQGHLPGIPSKVQAEKGGVGVGQMQKALLEKVEQLSLIVIQQNKALKAQGETNQQLTATVARMQEELSKLEKTKQ